MQFVGSRVPYIMRIDPPASRFQCSYCARMALDVAIADYSLLCQMQRVYTSKCGIIGLPLGHGIVSTMKYALGLPNKAPDMP